MHHYPGCFAPGGPVSHPGGGLQKFCTRSSAAVAEKKRDLPPVLISSSICRNGGGSQLFDPANYSAHFSPPPPTMPSAKFLRDTKRKCSPPPCLGPPSAWPTRRMPRSSRRRPSACRACSRCTHRVPDQAVQPSLGHSCQVFWAHASTRARMSSRRGAE